MNLDQEFWDVQTPKQGVSILLPVFKKQNSIFICVPEVMKPEKTVMIQNNFTHGFDPGI